WNRLLQQLKPLAAELVAEEEREPREIAAGTGQTGDEPQSQGIARDEDNWDRGGRILRRQGRRQTHGQNNVGLEAAYIFNEFRKALAPAFGPSLQQSNVLAIDVTMLTHPLAECVEKMLVGGRRLGAEERDAGGCDQTARLLRLRRKRPRRR